MKALVLVLLTAASPVLADAPVATDITASRSADAWRFDVTITHADTGWDHYADGWQVELADGTVLGTRVLAHPHVNEQPFTRSLSGVEIPADVNEVYVRTRCNVDGWSEETTAVTLP